MTFQFSDETFLHALHDGTNAEMHICKAHILFAEQLGAGSDRFSLRLSDGTTLVVRMPKATVAGKDVSATYVPPQVVAR